MWSAKKKSPYTNQRPLLPNPPPTHPKKHPHRPAPARLPTFYGAATARQNDAIVHQFSTSRVGAVFVHDRHRHLSPSQLIGPPRHPGVPRSPYMSDRVVEGSSASDSRRDPRVAPRPYVRTALVPPHYAPPDARAAGAVGVGAGRVRGLLVRDWRREGERRRGKLRRVGEERERMGLEQRRMEEEKRREQRREEELGRYGGGILQKPLPKPQQEPDQQQRQLPQPPPQQRQTARRGPLPPSSTTQPQQQPQQKQPARGGPIPRTLKTQPKPRRSCLKQRGVNNNNNNNGAPRKKKAVRFNPNPSLGTDIETGDPVPHRETDRQLYEARHAASLQQYLYHRAMRKQRAVVLMQERQLRVQRNGGIERDAEMQQRLMRQSISTEEGGGGSSDGRQCGEEADVVMLGMPGVDGERGSLRGATAESGHLPTYLVKLAVLLLRLFCLHSPILAVGNMDMSH
ncbi:hypothetical protein PG993_011891 [Apiospora rasikravindrae]|uniref:Uncharacterized protein n=1 Tax=Apiospora rasikravindrae TaxID=990691 RepID=A0ABR1S2D4_9PEZI